MGLDMYLEADVGFSNFDVEHAQGDPLSKKLRKALDPLIRPIADDVERNHYIGGKVVIPLAYWRKANQIHAWFVKNCQDGVDDCQRANVGREQLVELLEICTRVLADHSLAKELMPSQPGFFFGSYDYDDWYFENIEYTVKALERVLEKLPERAWIYYHSSW